VTGCRLLLARRIAAIAAAVLAIGCAGGAAPATPGVPVSRVIDGDTLEVRMAGRTERVRLIGVDTPEADHPDPSVQAFAEEATTFVRRLVGGRRVTLEVEPGREDRDAYGRLLRYVLLEDGRSLNEAILVEGYGFAYTRFPFARMEAYRRLEREAREAGRGLWGSEDPSAFRRPVPPPPAEPIAVDWREARNHLGRDVVVEGTIVSSHNSGRACFLNFDPDWHQYLSVVILAGDFAAFPSDPEAFYLGRRLRVRGRVELWQDRPQIRVRSSRALELVTPSSGAEGGHVRP
jgi:micrococcal nuclease